MNHRYSALAMSAFAMGAVVLTTTDASAMLKDPDGGSTAAPTSTYDWPDEGSGYPGSETKSPEYNYPNYDPKYEVAPVEAVTAPSQSADNGFDGAQLGASALGGAGVAFGGMWLYRRRHVLVG
jgi:hypothetical protein